MRRSFRVGMLVRTAVFLTIAAAPAERLCAQPLSPEQQAATLLNSARAAFNDEKYPVAAERFREFLRTFAGHKDAVWAQYGLGVALLEMPEKDYKAAVEALQPPAGRGDFADRPLALYYLGAAYRGLGRQALAQLAAKPAEAANLKATANQNFEEAARNFAQCAAAFAARNKAATLPASGLSPVDLDWLARARCDQADMLLRVGKFKEAGDLAAALLGDQALSKSRYRGLALYHSGYAAFMLRKYQAAGKALSELAPFQQEFGVYARYLLARVHHLGGERPEAAAGYKAVLAGHEAQRKAAAEALKNPAALKPEQKAFHESVLNAPAPEHVQRSAFYDALLLAEDGRYPEALQKFNALAQQYPKASFLPEVQLRQGYCQLQARNFPEATRLLQPLAEHAQLGDQATWWVSRAQIGSADSANAAAYQQALNAGMETLRKAAQRSADKAAADPEAKVRRGDILMELGDTQQLAKQYKEAAATYQQVLSENNNPDRAEEALQRQITALHLAGQYPQSDDLCQRFEKTHPKSTLLPAVVFREGENAYMQAVAALAANAAPDEVKRLLTQAIARYQRLVKQFPEFQYANLARGALGTAQYRLGNYAEAIAVFSAIPESDRSGELASVSYLLGDCLVRTLPREADDAIQAARMVEQAEQAAKLLETFLGAVAPVPPAPPPAPVNPNAPDALLKLAYCYERIGAVLIDPAERQKVLQAGREACERSQRQFPQDPTQPMVVFQRAKCLALLGDANSAVNELNRFRAEPLKSSTVAPLAILRQATLLRALNRAPEAAAALAEVQTAQEAVLLKDPARADWAPAIQYERGLALREAGKLADARGVFEGLVKQFAGRPEAMNAAWRAGQCRREEGVAAMAAAKVVLARPGAKPEELAAARQTLDDTLKAIRTTAESFQAQAAELGKKSPGGEPHLRLMYESAWCWRVLAEGETDAARQKLRQEAADKLLAKAKETGAEPPSARPAEPPLSAVPLQPAEKSARQQYQQLIAVAPESSLAVQARFELAELLAQRAEHDPAMALLVEALERNPAPELGERIRLRVAGCLLAKGDAKNALVNAQAVLKNPASPNAAEARFLAGEAFIQLKDWPKAIEQLVPLRDQGPLTNVPGVSDRGLLRLGQAYAQAGQWELSRQAMEILAQRFPQSVWFDDARYGAAFAWQNLKQLDNAVAGYGEVVKRTVSELGAKAQLQIGLCRLEQKRYPEAIQALLAVPYTYDYPDVSAAAWCEAGRAYLESNQPGEAVKAWQRVTKDNPDSQWAKTAQQRLAGMK